MPPDHPYPAALDDAIAVLEGRREKRRLDGAAKLAGDTGFG